MASFFRRAEKRVVAYGFQKKFNNNNIQSVFLFYTNDNELCKRCNPFHFIEIPSLFRAIMYFEFFFIFHFNSSPLFSEAFSS